MTLDKIEIENFKCFEKAEIDFSQITLITGANSSGKSSILYSILGAIQSEEFPFQFSPNGKYVNMGDYWDIVLGHKRNNKIKLNFQFDTKKDFSIINTTWVIDSTRNLPKLERLEFTKDFVRITISKEGKARKYRFDFEYDIEKDPRRSQNSPEFLRKLLSGVSEALKDLKIKEGGNPDETAADLDEFVDKFGNPRSKISFKVSELSEIIPKLQVQGNITSPENFRLLAKLFQTFDKKINFISSFRLYPERTYYETSKANLKVGRFGENYEDQIIYWEANKTPEYRGMIQALRNLELLQNVKASRLDGGRYELQVVSKENGIESSISDVGFGISQFLPIVVADYQLPRDSTLLIAQPEIHLHPSVQANFGNYLLKQVNAEGFNKKYIIETHSEYLLNRLRLLIVEKKLKESQVSLLYVQNNGHSSKIHKLELLQNGQIKNAPEEFFQTYMMDVLDISLKAN